MSRDHAGGRGLGRRHVSPGELSGRRRGRADTTERLCAALAKQSLAELTVALDASSPEVARTAIRRLAELDGARAAPELRARLLSADLFVVADIAQALRRLGDAAAVELAIRGLRAEPYTGQLAAALALGALADGRAAPALRAALHDPIAGLRVAALGALANIGPDTGAADDCAQLLSIPMPTCATRRSEPWREPRPGRERCSSGPLATGIGLCASRSPGTWEGFPIMPRAGCSPIATCG